MQLGLSDTAKRVVSIIFIVAAVLALAWRGKWTWDQYQDYKTEMAACDAAIAKTQTEIQAQRQDLNDVTTDKQSIMANYHELGEIGRIVAQYQTDWARYAYQYSICQEGEKSYYEELMYDTLVSLKQYFEEVPFGWFAYKGDSLAWRCATNYAFYTDNLRTVWVCQPASAASFESNIKAVVYAYVTADFSVKTGKFSGVEVYVTQMGEEVGVDRAVVDYPVGDFPVLTIDGKLVDSIAAAEGSVNSGEVSQSDVVPDGTSGGASDIDDQDVESDPDEESGDNGESEDETSDSGEEPDPESEILF